MNLNTLKPAAGSKFARKRVGRGIGSGSGKTCGRGHKGQKSRSGGKVGIYFEGGQMPLQRRLPKFGFKSRVSQFSDQVTLSEIDNLAVNEISVECLQQAGVIKKHIKHVKVILSGEVTKVLTLKGIKVTKGAKQAIVDAGGSVEE